MSTATSSVAWAAETIAAPVGELRVARAGRGPALVVLPRDNGHPPSNPALDLLAENHTIYNPWYPGFHEGGPAADWDWLVNPRDLAVVMLQLVDGLGLDRPALMGFGFGGWLAAEMATMASSRLSGLVLVSPMGMRPESGYIYDQFIGSTETYAKMGFSDPAAFSAIYGEELSFEQLEGWETDREMTSRLAWKPYMHNRALEGLVAGISCPVQIAWGQEDRIVPASALAKWRAALPAAKVEVLAGTGHAIDLEQPRALAAIVGSFLGAAR